MPCNDKEEKIKIIKKITSWIKNALSKNQEIIIMEDFNEREESKKQRSDGLIRKLLKFDLVDIHKFLFGNGLKDTWSNGNTSSRIDYIFSSRNIVDNIDQHEILDNTLIDSDHKILTMRFKVDEYLEKSTYKNNVLKSIKKDIYTQKLKFNERDWEQLTTLIEKDIEQEIVYTHDQTTEVDIEKINNKEKTWNLITTLYKKWYDTIIKNKQNDLKEISSKTLTVHRQ
jgi:hypothetical protein